jgi:hypothetical protein
MLRKALITIVSFLPATSVFSAGLDLKLSSESAEATFLTSNATFGYGGADIGIGIFFNENDDIFANASILVSGSGTGDVRALHFGVGGKLYGGRLDFEPSPLSGGAIAVGGHLRYVFPASMPFALLAEGWWAPEVTSFSDYDGLLEYRFAFELEVTPSARAYLGYRVLEFELDTGVKYKADDNAHIGVRFAF